mgnify:CR=1 FL=1
MASLCVCVFLEMKNLVSGEYFCFVRKILLIWSVCGHHHHHQHHHFYSMHQCRKKQIDFIHNQHHHEQRYSMLRNSKQRFSISALYYYLFFLVVCLLWIHYYHHDHDHDQGNLIFQAWTYIHSILIFGFSYIFFDLFFFIQSLDVHDSR